MSLEEHRLELKKKELIELLRHIHYLCLKGSISPRIRLADIEKMVYESLVKEIEK